MPPVSERLAYLEAPPEISTRLLQKCYCMSIPYVKSYHIARTKRKENATANAVNAIVHVPCKFPTGMDLPVVRMWQFAFVVVYWRFVLSDACYALDGNVWCYSSICVADTTDNFSGTALAVVYEKEMRLCC